MSVMQSRILVMKLLLKFSPSYNKTVLSKNIGVRPQCGQLKPRMLKIQPFWAYILDFLYKYLDISP